MYQLLLTVHVIVAVLLVVFILLQQGKGAATGASFGSGASTTVFGSQGSAGFMSRATWVLVACFFTINLTLAYLTNKHLRTSSVDDLVQGVAVPGAEIPDQDGSAPFSDSDKPSSSDIPGE